NSVVTKLLPQELSDRRDFFNAQCCNPVVVSEFLRSRLKAVGRYDDTEHVRELIELCFERQYIVALDTPLFVLALNGNTMSYSCHLKLVINVDLILGTI